MPEYQDELRVALAAVREASRVCVVIQKEITPETLAKQDKSPVTVADFSSQALICRALQESYSHDPIIAEEDARELRQPAQAPFLTKVIRYLREVEVNATPDAVCCWIDLGGTSEYRPRFWTVDPIDGTKGFLRGEQYAVALALIVNGEIAVGVLGCPNIPFDQVTDGTLFYAVRGQGAFAAPLDQSSPPRSIRVSPITNRTELRFCESVESGHSQHDVAGIMATKLGIHSAPLRLDSQAKYGVVSRGEAHVYLRLPTRADYREKIWDHAAGVLIVQEAGGKVTDVHGKKLEFTHGRELKVNQGVIVTTGGIHDEVLNAYAEAITL